MTNPGDSRSHPVEPTSSTTRARVVAPLIGAIAFLALYLAVDVAAGAVGTGTMLLPGVLAIDVYEYLSANMTGSILTGVFQALSVIGTTAALQAVTWTISS